MKPNDLPVDPVAVSPQAKPRTRLRALRRDDHSGVMALFERHGWPQRSRAGWDWALFDSPAYRATDADAGWVLEFGDAIVGFLGNLPVMARHDGAPVWGATCTSYLVDDAQRAHSTRLMRAFAAQAGAAFTWSATANEHSAPVYQGFRYRPLPQVQAQQRLRWWAHEGAAAQAWAQSRGCAWLSGPAAAAGDAWSACKRITSRPTQVQGLRVERLSAVDLLLVRTSHWPRTWNAWAKALAGRSGLWTDRSAATMGWRMSDPDLCNDLALWALRDAQGRMLGMCMARKLEALAGGAPRAELMDFALLGQAPNGAAGLLLSQVLQWARSWRLACVDAKRWTGAAALQLNALSPRVDSLPAQGVWMLVNQAPGLPALPQWPDWPRWDMTGTDSDDWFCTNGTSIRSDAAGWRNPRPLPAGFQPLSADDSSVQSSAAVSTSEGSKRNMSTV